MAKNLREVYLEELNKVKDVLADEIRKYGFEVAYIKDEKGEGILFYKDHFTVKDMLVIYSKLDDGVLYDVVKVYEPPIENKNDFKIGIIVDKEIYKYYSAIKEKVKYFYLKED